jgi:hypothetical protein
MIPAAIDGSVTTGLPEVAAADALDDRSWFCERPDRRFRARIADGGLWLIQRLPQGANPDVNLRIFSPTIAPPARDSDGELAALWYTATYPDWPTEKALRRARKAGVRR